MPAPIAAVAGAAARGGSGVGAGIGGKALSFGSYMSTLNKALEGQGTLNDEIVVTVRGNKGAKKADLYKLAAAVAFGQVQAGTGLIGSLNPWPSAIMMENHLHDISVTFTLRMSRPMAAISTVNVFNNITGATGTLPKINALPVFVGPSDDYTGGDWNFSSLLTSLEDAGHTKLPFNKKPILWASSSCPDPTPDPSGTGAGSSEIIPSPNPRPAGDYRSRGTLVELVFTALSNPGSTELMEMPSATTISNSTFAGGP